ncbi:hypothetical protein ACE2AJ_20185 [Aquihabitans daechungensis]|uniref:hypothetical protein n=1 Tax=Aquihabitans daechungensis TaxID=1052257 RepID=UPI003BA36A71
MSIEVVPQPRIDQLVATVDGVPRRRTDHRGMVWFGGRQAPQTGSVTVIHKQTATIVTPFWLPDTLAYRSDRIAEVVVTIAASVLYLPDTCALAEVTARLAVNEQQPHLSHVLVQMQGSARVPLGVSYDVTVLAPPDAVT